MARRLLAAVVLVCVDVSVAAAAPPAALTLVLAGCGELTPVLRTAQREAARVWSQVDVRVEWSGETTAPALALDDRLIVRCVPSDSELLQPTAARGRPIAGIRFHSGVPTTTVVVSLENARALLHEGTADAREMNERFKVLRELRLGRMLGRAIAHEVGHYVTRSNGHTERGLMKATHTVGDLTGASLGPFAVDPMAGVRVARAATIAADEGR